MGWAAWRVVALGCLGVACIESVPVQTIDGAQSGLLILEDRYRKTAIAFEGRKQIRLSPNIRRALLVSLACPLATYGFTAGELEMFSPELFSGDGRYLPSVLGSESLESVGVAPIDIKELYRLVLPGKRPFPEIPSVQGGEDQVFSFDPTRLVAFGDELIVDRLTSPFGQDAATWEEGEAGDLAELAWASAPRGPQGEPRAAVLVQTISGAREIRVVERGEGRHWRTVVAFPVPMTSELPSGLAVSWRDSLPEFLIVSSRTLQWTLNASGWESFSRDPNLPSFDGRLVGAVPKDTGWWFTLEFEGYRTYKLDRGFLGEPQSEFIAESQDGWWSASGKPTRRTAKGRYVPIEGPSTSPNLVAEHEGALLTWEPNFLVYWPAERCTPAMRWPGEATNVVRLALTDAYVARVVHTSDGWRLEWRARPDRTPTNDLE